MNVAVYPGSFNPLHKGHLAIMTKLCTMFDEVRLVISPRSPFKEAGLEDSAPARMEAAEQALRRHPELRLVLDDIELTMPSPQFTVRTLDALREREPEKKFTLVIGADQMAMIRQWRDYRKILLDYGIAVFPRKGYNRGSLKRGLLDENPDYRITLVKAPPVNISSSKIREEAARGRDVSKYLM